MTYGTANVSAVFEKLNEGEYVITGLNGSKEENIVARAGEKVAITLSDFDPQSDYDVHYESDDSKKIESEIDPTQKTISFIMPEGNVDITAAIVKSQGGSSNVPSEELTATPGGDTGEESDGTTENTDEKVKKEDNDKNGTTTVEENNTDQNDSEAKSAVQGAERKNTAVSTTAAPVKAGTPVSVYSVPVRSAGSSTTAAQTGDKTNTPLWIAAAAGSVVAALGAFVIRRKKNSEE